MRWPWTTKQDWKNLAATRLEQAEEADRRARTAIAAKDAELAVCEKYMRETVDLSQRRIEALMALHREDIVAANAARAEAEKRYETLALQVVELKRAEAGLPPMAFDATLLDPMNSLGPKTQLAINDFAGGDREMQKYLVSRAALEWSALAGQMSDVGEIDKTVAAMVRRGDG